MLSLVSREYPRHKIARIRSVELPIGCDEGREYGSAKCGVFAWSNHVEPHPSLVRDVGCATGNQMLIIDGSCKEPLQALDPNSRASHHDQTKENESQELEILSPSECWKSSMSHEGKPGRNELWQVESDKKGHEATTKHQKSRCSHAVIRIAHSYQSLLPCHALWLQGMLNSLTLMGF
jgi:hypothetical protein